MKKSDASSAGVCIIAVDGECVPFRHGAERTSAVSRWLRAPPKVWSDLIFDIPADIFRPNVCKRERLVLSRDHVLEAHFLTMRPMPREHSSSQYFLLNTRRREQFLIVT